MFNQITTVLTQMIDTYILITTYIYELRIMYICNSMVDLLYTFCGKTKLISFATSNLLEKIRKPFCKSNQICSRVQIRMYALGALLNHISFPLALRHHTQHYIKCCMYALYSYTHQQTVP